MMTMIWMTYKMSVVYKPTNTHNKIRAKIISAKILFIYAFETKIKNF